MRERDLAAVVLLQQLEAADSLACTAAVSARSQCLCAVSV